MPQSTEGNFGVIHHGIRGYNGPVYSSGWSFNVPTQDLVDAYDSADKRKNASILLGGQPNQTAVLSSASELLSQIPYILKPSQKSEILLIETDFPAVTRPWLQYCENHNCSVMFIKENPKEDLTEKLISYISANTSIIAISFIQYSTGTKLDIEIISKIAKSKGIKPVSYTHLTLPTKP